MPRGGYRTGSGRKRKYPWDHWFALPRVLIRHGVDYHISQSMMYVSIKNNASQRGLRTVLRDTGDGFIIINVGVCNGESRATDPLAEHSQRAAVVGSDALEEDAESGDVVRTARR